MFCETCPQEGYDICLLGCKVKSLSYYNLEFKKICNSQANRTEDIHLAPLLLLLSSQFLCQLYPYGEVLILPHLAHRVDCGSCLSALAMSFILCFSIAPLFPKWPSRIMLESPRYHSLALILFAVGLC